ncbi:WXG100 family type VII secretion target [Actinokineospora sp.]|uniref:WXG100 family type VII secretion target n=1 Tax=Actinokineospora sp. TaxID=1872133 RepID=UPI004037E60B
MLIKGNFGQLDDLAGQIMRTVGQVQQEMDTWGTTSGATAEDWLDRAGGQFSEVSAAWHQVSTAQQAMLEALRGGVDRANGELQQALATATARVGSVSI